ncbi:hypothetical protein GJV07_23150 [Enterobacteriaceae bacterium RIT711]|nr:hypothetical protein [Enterobacteriaceae bacterium RIT711]
MTPIRPYRRGEALDEVREIKRLPASAGPLLGKKSGGGGGVSVSQDVGQAYHSQRKQPKAGNSF